MKDTRRYWYFATEQDMGDTMSLCPRTPMYKGGSEPDDKRICVAPTAAHCLSAIGSYPIMHIYRTKQMVKAHKPYDVGDSRITQEHWLTRKTSFERVTVVSLENLNSRHWDWMYCNRGGGNPVDHVLQRNEKKAIIRYLSRFDKRLCNVSLSNQRWRMTK